MINFETITEDDLYELIRTYSIYGPCRKLYELSIIIEKNILFDEKLAISEDLIFNLAYLEFVNRISIINKPYYYYRNNQDSLTHLSFNKTAYRYYSYVSNKLFDFVKSKRLFSGNTKNIITTHFVEGYLTYITRLISTNDIDKIEKRLIFNKFNLWDELDFHLSNYCEYKDIRGVYKFIIKSKNIYLWEMYLYLSELKNKIVKL